MTKHTPGPWEIGEDCGAGAPIVTAECRDICTVEAFFGDGGANARLIAAAPELLEACETVIHATACPEKWVQRVADAIARAKGE